MHELPGRIVVDTNIWIYHVKGIPSARSFLLEVGEAARQRRLDIFYSTITEAELFSWPGLSTTERDRIERLLKLGEAVDVDSAIAREAATIRAVLGQAGQKVPKLPDALIAATALLTDAAVVSHNRPDFARVEGLVLVDPILRTEVVASGLP
jgi:predicted nucleic acid-binding protein